MKLVPRKKFAKAYAKLDAKLQSKVDDAILIFRVNPTDRILENHALKGRLLGKRAIKVTGDVRIIFQEIDSYVVIYLLDVGKHNQVY